MEAATKATAGEAILEVKNIEVVFNDVILVLRGLSLAARRGGITALVGLNGSGKSTLLRTMLGELPYHGELKYRCGHDHTRPTSPSRTRWR